MSNMNNVQDHWSPHTWALANDAIDSFALQLRMAMNEKHMALRFEGHDVLTKNPGWLDAALVAVDFLSNRPSSPELVKVLGDIRDKTESILKATTRQIEDENEFKEELLEMQELYEYLIRELDNILKK